MRQIGFRGIRKDNDKWIFGSLVYYGNLPFIVGMIVESNEEYISLDFWQPIKPETVGQNTGLKDNSNPPKKIYEGDIVKLNCYATNDKRKIAVIEWIKVDACFAVQNHESEIFTIGRIGPMKVIGNIYQHSHLLKGNTHGIS